MLTRTFGSRVCSHDELSSSAHSKAKMQLVPRCAQEVPDVPDVAESIFSYRIKQESAYARTSTRGNSACTSGQYGPPTPYAGANRCHQSGEDGLHHEGYVHQPGQRPSSGRSHRTGPTHTAFQARVRHQGHRSDARRHRPYLSKDVSALVPTDRSPRWKNLQPPVHLLRALEDTGLVPDAAHEDTKVGLGRTHHSPGTA